MAAFSKIEIQDEFIKFIQENSVSIAALEVPENLRKSVDLIRPASIPEDCIWVPSILVTTNWNRNDDVFSPEEVYKSYQTILNKPVNWQHNGGEEAETNETIGVVTQCLFLDANYLPATLESNSEKYHVLIGSLIWKDNWPTYAKDIQEQVEKNILYVSMECRSNYGYALQKEGSEDILLVNMTSQVVWMDKYLRKKKGPGYVTFKNGDKYKIGKWHQNIIFGGVGFVNKPGNIESIIIPDKLTCVNNMCRLVASLDEIGDIEDPENDHTDIDKPEVIVEDPLEKQEVSVLITSPDTNKAKPMCENKEMVDQMKTMAEKIEAMYKDKLQAVEAELASTKSAYESAMKDKETKALELAEAVKATEAKFTQAMKDMETKAAEEKASLAASLAEATSAMQSTQAKLDKIEKEKVGRTRFEQLKAINAVEDSTQAFEDLTEMTEGEFNKVKSYAEATFKKLTSQTVTGMQKSTDQNVTSMKQSTEASENVEIVVDNSKTEASLEVDNKIANEVKNVSDLISKALKVRV